MKRRQILINKPVYLSVAILKISKIVIYEFCYDYLKPRSGEEAILSYMDTDSFIMWIKTDDIYKDIEMVKLDLILQIKN